MTESKSPARKRNFLRDIIDADLASGRHAQVHTRFPPEPNGYLHIGHAKSICLNFGLAEQYGGVCNLRMDDTNPEAEDPEFVASIQDDIRWLGFDWGEEFYHASGYFEALYTYAVELIEAGLAYVDSQTVEEIRQNRGSLKEIGTPSLYRDRSVQENLDLFKRMRAGEFADGAHVLRAKIDMGAANLKMRDPLMYRIRHVTHHTTGDDWCIYPMYDYAHCMSDAMEGITHSICTLEFENNRDIYDWMVQHTSVPAKPKQFEFARLELDYTMMSKRKLALLVQGEHVNGWDDPRMPTIAGLRRRGYTAESIRSFAEMIGVAKTNSVVDIGKLEFCIRDDLNRKAPRRMCVLDPLKIVITDMGENMTLTFTAASFPHDVGLEGARQVQLSREIFIERGDFMEQPPKRYHRLALKQVVRLRYGPVVRCDEIIKDDEGQVVALHCTRLSKEESDQTKVKGTIHWASARYGVKAEVRLYDRLFNVARPGAERDFIEDMNPDSLTVVEGIVEPSVVHDEVGSHYQFERQGYFFSDPIDSAADALVFNRVVGLRDAWAKMGGKAAQKTSRRATAPKAKDTRPQRKSKAEMRAILHERSPETAARFKRFVTELKLTEETAGVLTEDLAVAGLFEAALAVHPQAKSVAKWVRNELMGALKTSAIAELRFDGAAFGALVALVDGGLSTKAGREVLATMLKTGEAPEAIVKAKGLDQSTDTAALESLVDAAIETNPEQAERYRGGNKGMMGFFVGQVMRQSGGQADPKALSALLRTKLG